MNKTDSEFDILFDQAFEQAFDYSPVAKDELGPDDHRPSWIALQPQLAALRRKQKLRSNLTRVAIVASSILLGAVIFGNTQAAKAIEPLVDTIKESPGGVYTFIFGRSDDNHTDGALTTPPPDFSPSEQGGDGQLLGEGIEVPLDQLQSRLTFAVPEFTYLPQNYSNSRTTVNIRPTQNSKKSSFVMFNFEKEDGYVLHVQMEKFKSETGLAMKTPKTGISVDKIELSTGPAILTVSTNGLTALETFRNGIYVYMSGKVSSDEMIAMFEGMRTPPL
ncbi:DUF4367 domain-containing protein [Cohnella faecalis]|uniref:DUF4367 domain-containing protein n=1 Tax=Cohnella faecalis TaxID=2315694 RepID=UPI0013145222|nr:DUF4367 domain-containing protein [Cohnella faecalis]